MRIETVTEANIDQIVPLIRRYQEFYRVPPAPPSRNRAFFAALARDSERGIQFVAFDERGQAVGFTTLYFLPSSLSAETYCVLNDLYTAPESRGRGVGRLLMEHAAQYARQRGFTQMDWMTERGNSTAQHLYDRIPASKSEWIYYSLSL